MSIAQILAPARIHLDVEASSKKRALERMSEYLSEGDAELSSGQVFDALLMRERLGSTGLGEGFAVPHARVAELDQTVACFFRLKEPVNFEAPDNQPVDLVFTIVIPEEATEEHLMILSSLASIFSRAEVCEAIRSAGSKEEIAEIIAAAER